jgi:pyridoxamine 5'-phosphate oxidase
VRDEAPAADPLDLFRTWLGEAERSEPSHPNACSLATIGADGRPSVRIVLLRGLDPRGFSFFTNFGSRKGRDLSATPWAAMTFHWKTLSKQVRIEGAVEKVEGADADAYWGTRPRASQIAAWASAQSETLPDRSTLDEAVARTTARFEGGPVPRPPFWGGYRLRPDRIEFWQEGASRLHTRWEYERRAGDVWVSRSLWP